MFTPDHWIEFTKFTGTPVTSATSSNDDGSTPAIDPEMITGVCVAQFIDLTGPNRRP